MGPSVVQVRVQQLNFLLTGIFTTVCNQVIFNQGGAEQSTLLLSMPSYIGMMLIAIMPEARVRTFSSSSSTSSSSRSPILFA